MENRVFDGRAAVREMLAAGHQVPPELLMRASRSDRASILADLQPNELSKLFAQLSDEALADLLAEIDPLDAARLLRTLNRGRAADVLEEMAPDDAADVVGELSVGDATAILDEMTPADAHDVRRLLAYPPDSAGGIMTSAFVAVAPYLAVDEVLEHLGRVSDAAETVHAVYVTDPDSGRLLGVLPLRRLVLSPRWKLVSQLMRTGIIQVRADATAEDAARRLKEHHFVALPVVDEVDRLLGIITADDASKVLLAEAGDDLERIGGAEPLDEPYLRASVWRLFRKRIGWLLILFVAEAYTGTVLRHFEETLTEMVSLAFFIPLLIGTGGNTGSQTVTTLIRGLATGDVHPSDWRRVLLRELSVGGLLGVVMGAATYLRAWTLGVGVEIGPVVAITAVCIVIWAAVVAAALPLVLRRLHIDPAVVSGPFITTLVDGTGLFLYFTVARLLLGLG